jgi:hypothetical protein
MKRLLTTVAILGTIGVVAPGLADSIPDQDQDVQDMLVFMRQEEKLARDVYLYLDGLYGGGQPGTRIFARIAESEQRHTDAVAELLTSYGIEDEVADAAIGEFADPALQELYDTLIVVGSAGLTEGLGVGVLIERKDMTDIVKAIEVSLDYDDIVKVYTNLLAGSERHLDSFLKVLDTSADSSAAAMSATPGGGHKGP